MTDPTPQVQVRTGVDGDSQDSSFGNATLQATGDHTIEFSIATTAQVPADVSGRGEQAVADFLAAVLAPAASGPVRFDIQVGPAGG